MEEVELFSFTQNMTDAVVLEWFVEDGQRIEAGQEIVEVESEKATQVIPAPTDGVISVLTEEGDRVDVGQPLAEINVDADGDDLSNEMSPDRISTEDPSNDNKSTTIGESNGKEKSQKIATDRPTANRSQNSERTDKDGITRASPAARKLAREEGINTSSLRQMEGSGPHGALIQRDIEKRFETSQVSKIECSTPSTTDDRGIYEQRDGTQLRQAVASQMTTSAQGAPQVTLNRSISVEALLDLKGELERDLNWELSLTDFLIAAIAEVNQDHPEFNAIYEDGTHKLAENVNIGFAVDLEDGLITPVIKNANCRTLRELSAAREELVKSAQKRSYTAEDLANGTITITNLGHFEIDSFDPLLNVPEVAMLGVGTVKQGLINAKCSFNQESTGISSLGA